MKERLENQGRLKELELNAKRIGLSISGLLQTLRTETNPHKEIMEMNEELIHEQAFELSQKINQFKGIQKKITALKDALGIE